MVKKALWPFFAFMRIKRDEEIHDLLSVVGPSVKVRCGAEGLAGWGPCSPLCNLKVALLSETGAGGCDFHLHRGFW